MAASLAPLPAPQQARRAVGFAVTAVAFAVAAHTAVEGTLPPTWAIAIAAVLVAAGARAVTGLELRGSTLLVALVTCQLSLHALFLLASRGGPSSSAAGWLCCGSTPSGGSAARLAVPTATSAVTGQWSTANLVQLGLNLLTAVILALALRFGERAIWRTVRRLAATAGARLCSLLQDVARVLLPGQFAEPLDARRQPAPRRPRRLVLAARVLPRRGPPQACPAG